MSGREHNLQNGTEVIRAFIKTLPKSSGVYQMLDAHNNVLYVGKAKNLPKRVANYTLPNKLPIRTQRMIALTDHMTFTTTHTEAEALLLEANLIKKLKPRYNILLRDDKSFPYIHITAHDYPQVTKHRGARNAHGNFFGPFASAGAVNKSLALIQKAFLLRNCTDNVFKSRTRPCLQYQIKRCTAPCVRLVSAKEYNKQVKLARDFLSGKSRKIQDYFAEEMQIASDNLDFENAAMFRDRIRALSLVQSQHSVQVTSLKDADLFAIFQEGKQSCVQVFFYRGGQNFGNHAYFPRHEADTPSGNILEAFIGQFYANKPAPPEILTNIPLPHADLVQEALSLRAAKKVLLSTPKRGGKKQLLQQVLLNAKEALIQKTTSQASQRSLLNALSELLGFEHKLHRIEVYDNSHIQGSHALGAMIVATEDGFNKSAYRKFNIKDPKITNDDFAMMREVFTRRFKNALKEDPNREKGGWPDLVLIDGGKGQLSAVVSVFEDLGISDIPMLAIAKGPDRNAGRERFFMPDRAEFTLPPNDPVMYFLQRLRDESHRFVIGSHRIKRAKSLTKSPLDDIAGIGPQRKKALLHYFGSAKAVSEAGLGELEIIDGISKTFAKKIYSYFHDEA